MKKTQNQNARPLGTTPSLHPSTTHPLPSTNMKLTSFTCLAFLINRVIDAGPDPDLSYHEIFDAAADRCLISLLACRYGHLANFTFVTQNPSTNVEAMEAALCDAATAYEGRVGKPTGPVSGLCLSFDLVLEAIQSQFHTPPRRPSASEPAHSHPCFPFVNGPWTN